jgi:hypothetical protein
MMAAGSAPKKANLLIALGGLKKKPGALGEAEPDADDMGMDDEAPPPTGEVKSMAAGDVMAAFKSGDTVALEDALSRFVEACRSEGYG